MGWVALRRMVTVRVARAGWVGGELGEEALPVPFAHPSRPSQAGTGRGLACLDLDLIGRPNPSTGAGRCGLVRAGRLGCGVVAWRVRLCGFGAGLSFGPRCCWWGCRPAPSDLLHEQVGGEDQGDRGHREHQLGDRPVRGVGDVEGDRRQREQPG
jgi:hypothetical protein